MRNPQRITNDWYYDTGEFILGFSAKVASSSIILALKETSYPRRTIDYVRQQNKKNGVPVVLFFREPIDRLVSFWWMIESRQQNKTGLLMPFEEFCEYILRWPMHSWDHHWIPQSMWHGRRGQLVPNIVYPMSSIKDEWPILFPNIELPHRNPANPGKPDKDELFGNLPLDLQERVLLYYKQDSEIFHDALQKYVMAQT